MIISKTQYFLSKKVGKAIADYKMLKDKDRILVGVSGGKDSLALIKILHDRLRFVPITYELIAAHIDQDAKNASVVKKYLTANGYKYYIKKIKSDKPKKIKRQNMSPCFWCSWKRREALFGLATKLRCNKIALAHHKDDIIQTQLLNLFFNGEISTMRPIQEMFGGKLHIIRPFAYAEEDEIIKFAGECAFPSLPNKCAVSGRTNRAYMARIISDLKKISPKVKDNIFRSLRRIRKDYLA